MGWFTLVVDLSEPIPCFVGLLLVAVEGCAGIVRACEYYSLLLLSDEKDLGKIDSRAFFHLSLSHQHTVSCSEEN